jgi:hypothetical protein
MAALQEQRDSLKQQLQRVKDELDKMTRQSDGMVDKAALAAAKAEAKQLETKLAEARQQVSRAMRCTLTAPSWVRCG